MSAGRIVSLAALTVVAATALTGVLLAPVKAGSDRGVLPPIDNPPATEPR